ncbi:hypothetical protein BVIET440_140099 [Burkholderia vietnamiensis]
MPRRALYAGSAGGAGGRLGASGTRVAGCGGRPRLGAQAALAARLATDERGLGLRTPDR